MKTSSANALSKMVLVLVAVLMTSAAMAAENPKVNVNTFRQSVHPGDILNVQTANMTKSLGWGASLWLTLNHQPLRIMNERTGDLMHQAVTNQFVADVIASINFFDYIDLGVDIPLFIMSSGDEPSAMTTLEQAKGFALGDVRLGLKGSFLRHGGNGFGLALGEDVTFPTATKRNFSGDDGITSTTMLIMDYQHKGWLVALNAGVRIKKNVDDLGHDLGNQLLASLGLVVPIVCDVVEGIGTAEMRTKLTAPFDTKYDNALDLLGGVRLRFDQFSILAAAGAGVLNGYGSPKVRATLAASWEPKIDRGCCEDRDGDTVCDSDDDCPDEFGLVVLKGCPDRDGDGIRDRDDRCPDDPGPREFQGCPDRDGDQIPDIDDRCPDQPGPREFQGCPDTDGDGLCDPDDDCPLDPGPRELKGCPDRDGDGVIDRNDRCPDVKGLPELQGCPPAPTKVKLTEKKIEILEMVFFEFDKAVIMSESFDLLNQVAGVFKEHPEITRVEVQGHTDNKGGRTYNMKLSQARSEAVMLYLTNAGVEPDRLEAHGYGYTKPIATNKTEEGRAKNRRVEFVIKGKSRGPDGKTVIETPVEVPVE